MTAREAPTALTFAVPGWALDLMTDGVAPPITRQGVVMAVRSVMLSAHRLGIPYPFLHSLLTDTQHRRLAQQVMTGRGGRTIPAKQRDRLLADLWQQTSLVASQRPTWSRDDALAAIEYVRDNWEATADLQPRHRTVLNVVLDLATENGTTRPTVPVREVQKRTGIPYQTVSRILREIAAEGTWLRLAKRGNHRTRRASLYTLAPTLLRDFTDNVWGASPPKSHPVPMSHPPTSHSTALQEPPMTTTVTVTAPTPEEVVALLERFAAANPSEAGRLLEQMQGRHLRAVPSTEGHRAS